VKKALYGYGGHAREVHRQIGEDLTFFVDDNYSNGIAKPISTFDPEKFELMIAISSPKDRCDIVSRLPNTTKYFTFIHPTALILDKNIEIMEGSFIGAYSVLTTNIKIGKHSILNRANHIGHDTVIGDYFSAMPGAIVSGNVIIKNRVYIGTNSSIREKISICDDVVIGLNSGVVKNITSSGTYVGTPSKIFR
jgi:sugar O-acyltransferase (sialic acid O-acetyltransferase NeuD family)